MPAHPWQIRQMLAQPAIGYVLITGAGTADGDQIAINGITHEFDTDASTVAPVIRVDISGGASAAQSTTALVAAVNGNAARVVDALDIGGNCVALVSLLGGTVGNYTLTNAVDAGGTIAVAGANLVGGVDESRFSLMFDQYTVTAQDVTTLAVTLGTSEIPIGAFAGTTAPEIYGFWCRTAAGAIKDLTDGIIRVAQVNANHFALFYIEPAAGALLAATDIVSFALGVPGV